MKIDKTTLIVGALGVGALIYFIMNRNKATTTDKSTEGEGVKEPVNQPQTTTQTSISPEVEKFFAYRAFDDTGKNIIKNIDSSDQKKMLESKDYYEFKTNMKNKISKFKTSAELKAAIEEMNKPQTASSQAKLASPDEITREMITEVISQKGKKPEEIYPIYVFAVSYNQDIVSGGYKANKKKMTAETQLDESKEFLGMCNY